MKKQKELRIKKMSISKLKMAEYNPRIALREGDVEYEQLKRSIDKFGIVEPIVWNESTGNVVGGHQRLQVLIDKGEKEIEVSIVNLSLEDEKALNIALNKIDGVWDAVKLRDMLESMDDTTRELSGFTDAEIKKLFIDSDELKEKIEDSEKDVNKFVLTTRCPKCDYEW